MKGDFSRWAFNPADNYTGVLMQQGRVLSDTDVTAVTQIAGHWRETMARDAIGPNVVAAPAAAPASFRVTAAQSDGASVTLTLEPGRAWVDGILMHSPGAAPFQRSATYLGPPFQSPPASPATIGANVHDAVVLEAWEEALSAFQEPVHLLEPALGGPDTSERSRVYFALKLLRVGPNDDCASVAARLADDLAGRGRLTVTPAPSIFLPGECPLEAGGGYTGLEHHLYRIEIAEPAGGQARFKWSQFNGGLVGRGVFASTGATTGTVDLRDNAPAINHCGVSDFYLEALAYDAALGHYRVTLTANATLTQPGRLGLTGVQGSWPAAAPATAFFRLWNGIARVADFPVSATPAELGDGIQLQFQTPAANLSNYRPGDYWTFPVRASGTPMDPSLWPANAPPQGVRVHRAPLAIVHWQADRTAAYADAEIDDCRRVFRPLTNQKVCCTFTVGDGESSHGDFDSIEEALTHLPASGGEICLLPGLHHANAVIANRANVKIKGCDTKTKVVPRAATLNDPIFRVVDSINVTLEHMDLTTMGGTAIRAEGSRPGLVRGLNVGHNRILACTHAIRVVNGLGVYVHHNRIRMLDRETGDVAIYLAADDALVERNEIDVVPAPQTPPVDDPGGGGRPTDPTDPCARFELVYTHRVLFLNYVNLLWVGSFTFLPPAPYLAKGGIQLANGCERVRILENLIRGGAGDGITLGSGAASAQPPGGGAAQPDHRVRSLNGMILGTVVPPAGTSPSGIQLSFAHVDTNQTLSTVTGDDGGFSVQAPDGTYRVTVATPGLAIDGIEVINLAANRLHILTLVAVDVQPEPEPFGFLYDIAIEKNRIEAMGLCGIGIPSARAAAIGSAAATNALASSAVQRYLRLLGTPVIGLAIEGNRITRCLRNPFTAALQDEARRRGLGGVSLGFCQDLTIRENAIEDCGTRHIDPACGVYVSYGETVEITGNTIRNNGPLVAANDDLLPGRRGGIVLNLTAAATLLDLVTGTGQARVTPSPAARVHENLVEQPAGVALWIGALGPLQITDNAFSSEVSGVSNFERLAGTVVIVNAGGVQTSPPPSSFRPAGNLSSNVGAVASANTGGSSSVLSLLGDAPTDNAATGGINTNTGAASAGMTINTNAQPALSSGLRINTNLSAFDRTAAARSVLPLGSTTFCNNQSRTGAAVRSLSSHLLAVADDLDYGHNQSRNVQAQGLFSNVLLYGATLRASGNRMSEANAETLLSLASLASRLNATTYNQADH
ncbi:MAG TPA: DUF6519 domain-containing protein, partial [Pelomicrobium sp.]|nr:DUF6519 domain-containing protein [Pelomicrobium sp.]